MTAPIALPEVSLSLEELEIRSTRNLQELLGVLTKLFDRYRIDHAVLFSLPSKAWSMDLPLLPLHPALNEAMARAVRLDAHPAADVCARNTGISTLAELGGRFNEPIVEQLVAAFHAAGMRHVYEVPLNRSRDDPFVLEVARIGGPISEAELVELQTIARVIPGKLPLFVRGMPHDCEATDDDLRVR